MGRVSDLRKAGRGVFVGYFYKNIIFYFWYLSGDPDPANRLKNK